MIVNGVHLSFLIFGKLMEKEKKKRKNLSVSQLSHLQNSIDHPKPPDFHKNPTHSF